MTFQELVEQSKTRADVEDLHARGTIDTLTYNRYAIAWNLTPRFGGYMPTFGAADDKAWTIPTRPARAPRGPA